MIHLKNYRVALWAPLMFIVACSSTSSVKEEEPSPLRLLIGDGGVKIEESFSHPELMKGRTMANTHGPSFEPKEIDLPGKAWVEESSEYTLIPAIKSKVECHVSVTRVESTRAPAAKNEQYTYDIQVKVKDGISGGPFESVINGEGEGLVQLGEYPVKNWKSSTNIVVNETVIESWFYNAKKNHYEIVKKMGDEPLFLKKTLFFDPHLQNVKQVKYEILKGSDTGEEDNKTVLARLDCQS